MQRYRQYGGLDDTPEIFGDAGFMRLDMLTDPAMLDVGALSVSENMRFDANGATVRAGLQRLFPAVEGVGTIYGVGVYKPSEDEDYLAFATERLLVFFNLETQEFTYGDYPDLNTIGPSDYVDVLQAGIGAGTLPTVYVLRGTVKTVLKYDANGGTMTEASTFAKGNFGLFYQDRVAVGQEQDVPVSDLLDFTTFNTLSQFQILKGGNDYLQCFRPYQKDYVLIGTRQGWFIAFFDPQISGTAGAGYAGGLQDNSFMRLLTYEAGPVGPDAAEEANGMVWFISGGAIYAFAPKLDNDLTVLGRPISAPIQPIMDRMCVRYARKSSVKRYGYRLYFAMPISDEALEVATVTIVAKTTAGLTLPFTLPTTLSTSALVTITTTEDHQLNDDSRVQITGCLDSALNGEFNLVSIPNSTSFIIACNIDEGANVGTRIKMQKLATRNNLVAVYNLNNNAWESLDWMPTDIKADWLRVVEHAARRRLVLIDQDRGPFLYEETDADEVGDVTGGISLPFTLPITLSAANYATQPIAGRLRTRCYRWGVQPRKVTKAEVRSTLDSSSVVNMSFITRNPNGQTWEGQRTFTAAQFSTADAPLRKLGGQRALEAQVEITTQGGRPTFRAVSVETNQVGKVEE